jgi:hypothetical protein
MSHSDFIGGLQHILAFRLQLPSEPGLGGIQTDGAIQVFNPCVGYLHLRAQAISSEKQ